ncbi:MAG TPA: hypothetical protein VNN73_08290 [Blastocatellia bacterium]|nr:hypothetical protein [Blastocatellia bacterium]
MQPSWDGAFLVAAILDSIWQWWLLAILAFIYGVAILTMIIALLIKSERACYKKKRDK